MSFLGMAWKGYKHKLTMLRRRSSTSIPPMLFVRMCSETNLEASRKTRRGTPEVPAERVAVSRAQRRSRTTRGFSAK